MCEVWFLFLIYIYIHTVKLVVLPVYTHSNIGCPYSSRACSQIYPCALESVLFVSCCQANTLQLILTLPFFDAIKSGDKVWEFRASSLHWRKRIPGKSFVQFRNGSSEYVCMHFSWTCFASYSFSGYIYIYIFMYIYFSICHILHGYIHILCSTHIYIYMYIFIYR